jgi:choline kinase
LIDVIFNPRYRIANNWYSLLLALKTVGPLDREDRLLVVNSDLWGPTACLTGVFNSLLDLGGTRLAVDLNRPLTSESMKVGISSGGFLSCIGKEGVVPAAGEYIGALALDQHGATTLEGCLGECETDRTRWNEWYEHAINRSLQTIAWRVCPVIDSSWVEIDDADDLLQAEKAASR